MSVKQPEFQLLSPRKLKSAMLKDDQQATNNQLYELLKLILPPFLLTILSFLYRIISKTLCFIISLFARRNVAGEASRQFHKRKYEQNIESLRLKQEDLGYTNQILVQQDAKVVSLFLPVYVTCKIKSIQDVSVQTLTSNISCALIINVLYGDLPQEIITKLQSSIVVQLNRGQIMRLQDDGLNITVKRNKKAKFIIFTIRKVFLAFMIEDTLWSPFEVIELIISITLNTVTIARGSIQPLNPNTGFQPNKEYKISFNCMRNSDAIALSYALDCVYGVYDLAERMLESYHSRFGTYKEIIRNYEDQMKASAEKKRKEKQQRKKKEKEQKERKKKEEEQRKKKEQEQAKRLKEKKERASRQISDSQTKIVINPPQQQGLNFIGQVLRTSRVRRLSMRMANNELKTPPKKVKYFQYTHLVIPLYKYPGNSLFTIFLPTFLLALLSLAIFFQEPELSGRIGAIATMFLGYIALIPSIKQQLPPSSKLTVIQAVVYIQTVSCMLILYESFIIRNIPDYEFIWSQNFNFLLCLGIHSSTFLFVVGLYTIHKLKWEPSYNCDQKIPEIKPADNPTAWDNPYCDEIFIKYNQEVIANEFGQERQQKLIKPYKREASIVTLKQIEIPKEKPLPSLGKLQPFSERSLQGQVAESERFLRVVPTSPRSLSEFVPPDENLYYGHSKKE